MAHNTPGALCLTNGGLIVAIWPHFQGTCVDWSGLRCLLWFCHHRYWRTLPQSVVPIRQMQKCIPTIQSKTLQSILQGWLLTSNLDSISKPYNFCASSIRHSTHNLMPAPLCLLSCGTAYRYMREDSWDCPICFSRMRSCRLFAWAGRLENSQCLRFYFALLWCLQACLSSRLPVWTAEAYYNFPEIRQHKRTQHSIWATKVVRCQGMACLVAWGS